MQGLRACQEDEDSLIDNEYIKERKEFFAVLTGIVFIFLAYILIYALNDWSWTNTSASGFCEKVQDGWIREPANTISNLAFIFVGLYILWLAQYDSIEGDPSLSNRSWFLIMYAISCTAVGVGSFAMHGFNTDWGGWLDLTGMMMYITIPVFYNFSRFLKWTEKFYVDGDGRIATSNVSFGETICIFENCGTLPNARSRSSLTSGHLSYFPKGATFLINLGSRTKKNKTKRMWSKLKFSPSLRYY